jgi:hypothetical protein
MARLPFASLHKKILSIESSPPDPPFTHCSMLVGTRTCTHRRVHTHHVTCTRRRVHIFDKVILLCVYKVVDMKYSRQGGTKVLGVVEVILSSNGCANSVGPLLL